jgi:hypothetical protein
MPKVNLVCTVCNEQFLRDKKEYNRSQKLIWKAKLLFSNMLWKSKSKKLGRTSWSG